MKPLVVFAALFVLDLVWAKYTLAISAKQTIWAASYACVIIALSGFAAINYVNDPWMLLPAMAGAFFGTIVGIKYQKHP